eukprot:761768-Amphidinium_carterae.1
MSLYCGVLPFVGPEKISRPVIVSGLVAEITGMWRCVPWWIFWRLPHHKVCGLVGAPEEWNGSTAANWLHGP